MKLRFVGEDGSMGLKNGEVYDTRIFIKGKFLWVEWKVNLFAVKSCPYSSTKAFAYGFSMMTERKEFWITEGPFFVLRHPLVFSRRALSASRSSRPR